MKKNFNPGDEEVPIPDNRQIWESYMQKYLLNDEIDMLICNQISFKITYDTFF